MRESLPRQERFFYWPRGVVNHDDTVDRSQSRNYHHSDAAGRRERGARRRPCPRRDRGRAARDPGQQDSSQEQSPARRHRPGPADEGQCEYRHQQRPLLGPGRDREDGGGPGGRRRRDHGPQHRRRSRRHPRRVAGALSRALRDGADLPGDRGPAGGGRHAGHHPAHDREAGEAGRGLLHDPRRRAPGAPAAGREARHGNCQPGRGPARQMDAPLQPAESAVRDVRRNLRHHGRVRCVLLARAMGCGPARLPTPPMRHKSRN